MIAEENLQNSFRVEFEGSAFDLILEVKASVLQITLAEIKSSSSGIRVFKENYTLESLIKLSPFFKQFENIEKAFESVAIFTEKNSFQIKIKESKAFLCYDFLFTKISFVLHIEDDEHLLSKIPPEVLDMITVVKKKLTVVEKLILIVKIIKKEKDNFVNINRQLIEENQKLKNENNQMKGEILDLKNANFQLQQRLQLLSRTEETSQFFEDYTESPEFFIQAQKNSQENDVEIEDLFLPDSDIVPSAEVQKLLRTWISKDHPIKAELLYKARRDGDKIAAFHWLCDNQGPTLTIIQTEKKISFGGFTCQSWDQTGKYKTDPDAFLFNLDRKEIFKPKNPDHSICCCSAMGPTFGFGHDIGIFDDFMSNANSYSNAPFTFDVAPPLSLTGGEKNFRVKDLEVYKIDMSN